MNTSTRRLLLPLILLCLFALPCGTGIAEVNVNIGVFAPPPPVVIEGPPAMAVVVGTPYVYFAPDVAVGLFFYGGHWYRPHEGHWFRARSYRGPWAYIDHGGVPAALLRLPPDYRRIPPGHQKIPYGQMKKNWKNWERERHWDARGPGHPGNAAPRYEGARAMGSGNHFERNQQGMGNGNNRGHGGGRNH